MGADPHFINEVESAIANGSADRRSQILDRVTSLFVLGSPRFSEDDISVFDDVIGRLAARIERSARVLLANRLAPIANSPPNIIRTLAFDDAIEVAGPVLSQSARLDDAALIEVAKQKTQEHMLAITQRTSLSEAVTDVLVERGDREVVLGAVENPGARFSSRGFAMLVNRSEDDDGLAACVGSRPDIPRHLLLALIEKASQNVRSKLETANPHAKEAVREAVTEATQQLQAETLAQVREYDSSLASVKTLQQSGRLNEQALSEFARGGGFVETCAALGVMCELPLTFIEQAMISDRSENILVLARAIGLSWPTVKEILSLRAEKGIIAQSEIGRSLASFERLRSQTAREILRYYRSRVQGKPVRRV